jgi:hypothetical protein
MKNLAGVWKFKYALIRHITSNWIGCVNRMGSNRKVTQVFNSNLQGSRLRGRPKYRWWNCVQTGINICKITSWRDC